jgi:transposase
MQINFEVAIMAYSTKFREEAMEYVDGFHTHVEVAKMFHISEKTIRNWIKQRKETGNLKKKTPLRKAFKLEKAALLQYIKERPDAY